MAISRIKTWASGEVLTASDLNSEFNSILNNARDLISPLTGSLDLNGEILILDADADTSLFASTDDQVDLTVAPLTRAFSLTAASSIPYLHLRGAVAGYNNAIVDVNANEIVELQGIASAVNQIGVSNNSTGARPRLEARGEANVSFALRSRGTGEIVQEDAAGNNVGWAPRGYLSGLTMSTAGASATMSIAAGMARDSTNARNLVLSAALAKTTSAWAVGNAQGGLDAGTIANSTWYHFWLIQRSDTGIVDVLISTSATAPTMPTNYDYRRRIGAGRTDGSAQWTLFVQVGDDFLWSASVADANATNPGTGNVTRTLTVPTGVTVWARIRGHLQSGAGGRVRGLLASLSQADEAPDASAPLSNINVPASGETSGFYLIRTNTSSQIRTRLSFSDADVIIRLQTEGWEDRRGRDD